jgi:hypothetical protein
VTFTNGKISFANLKRWQFPQTMSSYLSESSQAAKIFPERGIYSASQAAGASKLVYTHWPEAE